MFVFKHTALIDQVLTSAVCISSLALSQLNACLENVHKPQSCIVFSARPWAEHSHAHTHTHTQMWTVYACVDVCMYSFMTLIYIRTVLNGKHLPSEEQQWITAGEARQTTEVPHEVMIPHKKQLTDISQVLASPTHSTLGCISTLGVWINKPGALVQSLRAETKEGFAACGVEGSVVDWIMLSLRRGSFSPLSFLQKASSPLSPLRTGNTVHACEFVDLCGLLSKLPLAEDDLCSHSDRHDSLSVTHRCR